MKRVVLLILLLVLMGCQKDAKYECQVSVRPTGKEPCDFVGGRDHICQLYGTEFEPTEVPDYCIEKCLERSKFLTSDNMWGQAIDLECMQVSVAHSGFEKPELTPEERRIDTVDLTYEEVEEDTPACDESYMQCCFDNGKCWIDGQCKKCTEGDCLMNSDCAPVCEGNYLWDQDCDQYEKICKKARKHNCADIVDTIAGIDIQRVCKGSACVVDESRLQSTRTDLVKQYNQYTYARQEVTNLRMHFDRQCLRALSDVTNKLIIDSALMLGSMPKTVLDIMTDATVRMIDMGANSGSKMSTEEFIAYSCSMNKVLTQELKLIDKKQEQVLDRIKDIEIS